MISPTAADRSVLPARLPALQPWRVLTLVSSVVMELSWIVPWLRLFLITQYNIGWLEAYLTLGGILLVTYSLDNILVHLNWRLLWRRVGLAAICLVSMAAGLAILVKPGRWVDWRVWSELTFQTPQYVPGNIPPEILILLACLWMNGRGLAYARGQFEPREAISRFRTGMLMSFLYGLVIYQEPLLPRLFFNIFLVSGLISMSAARLATHTRQRGSRVVPFDRKWLIGMVVGVGLAGSIANILWSWLAGEGLTLLFTLYTWVLAGLVLLLSPLLIIVDLVISYLFKVINLNELLRGVQDLIRNLQLFFQRLVDSLQGWFSSIENLFRWDWIPHIQIPRFVIIWGTILFVLLLVVISVQRRRSNPAQSEDANEGELEQTDLFSLMRAAIRKAMSRLWGEVENWVGLHSLRRVVAAARIRRIYSSLLKLFARMNLIRSTAETPLEFLQKLRTRLPNSENDLRLITGAYLRVRYGEIPETDEEIQAVLTSWRRVREAGERILHSSIDKYS